MISLHEYYENYLNNANIIDDFSLDANHCLPTLDYGVECTKKKSPYLGLCHHDGAGLALQQLYDNKLSPYVTAKSANLQLFDQSEFVTGTPSQISVDSSGYIYIPSACAAGGTTPCKLHVSFHGCLQDRKSIGDVYAANAGFNQWAEANNIVVVYPYAVANAVLGNPNACWDWWGYNDNYKTTTYVQQTGVQIKMTKAIVDRIMGK